MSLQNDDGIDANLLGPLMYTGDVGAVQAILM